MIPTMIVFGVVVGWWWRPALVAAALVWPTLLVATDVVPLAWASVPTLAAGALLATLNAAVGVAVAQAIRWLTRRARSRPDARNEDPRA